jgi:hypothetical protein
VWQAALLTITPTPNALAAQQPAASGEPAAQDELQRLQAENEALRADQKKAAARDAMFCNTIERSFMAMQAAVLEAKLTSPENGITWILNTLEGPGLLPDLDEARALGSAQAWFDKQAAELQPLEAKIAAPADTTGGAQQ